MWTNLKPSMGRGVRALLDFGWLRASRPGGAAFELFNADKSRLVGSGTAGVPPASGNLRAGRPRSQEVEVGPQLFVSAGKRSTRMRRGRSALTSVAVIR